VHNSRIIFRFRSQSFITALEIDTAPTDGATV